MAEWLVLLILVPAIVVPVVLLIGLAGCSFHTHVENPPVIQSAAAKSVCVITLTWQYGGAQPQTFQIVRTNPDGSTTTLQAPATASTFDDTGLLAASTYSYTVAAVYSSGPGTTSNSVTAITPPFQPTFQETLNIDSVSAAGFTLVQRIEAGRLTVSGTQVRLTLQASSTEGVSVDRIYISQPSSAAGANPYDSGADLTAIYAGPTPLVMASGQVLLVPAVDQTGINYTLDHTQPLLIAVDFSAAPQSGIEFVQPVPPSDATAYNNPGAEAALMNRSPNYNSVDAIIFFQKIEVG